MRPESASAMSRRVYSFYRAVTATYIISTLVVMAFYHSARWNSGGSDSHSNRRSNARVLKKSCFTIKLLWYLKVESSIETRARSRAPRWRVALAVHGHAIWRERAKTRPDVMSEVWL